MTDKEIDEMEAGRDLDTLIAEKVMNWHLDSHLGFYHWLDSDNQPRELIADFEPSTDIGAAWQVVEKMDLLYRRRALMRTWGGYAIYPYIKDATGAWVLDIRHPLAKADTAPLAICRAALKAVTTQE